MLALVVLVCCPSSDRKPYSIPAAGEALLRRRLRGWVASTPQAPAPDGPVDYDADNRWDWRLDAAAPAPDGPIGYDADNRWDLDAAAPASDCPVGYDADNRWD